MSVRASKKKINENLNDVIRSVLQHHGYKKSYKNISYVKRIFYENIADNHVTNNFITELIMKHGSEGKLEKRIDRRKKKEPELIPGHVPEVKKKLTKKERNRKRTEKAREKLKEMRL